MGKQAYFVCSGDINGAHFVAFSFWRTVEVTLSSVPPFINNLSLKALLPYGKVISPVKPI